VRFLFHFYDLRQKAGIQRAICELANTLVEHGDQIVVATHSARSEVAYRLDDRVIVEQTPYAELRMFGPLAWPARALWGLRQRFVLRKVIRHYQPDMIVDHGTALGLIYPCREMYGVPFVLQRHFPGQQFPWGKLLYPLLALLGGRKSVVVLTDTIAAEMRSKGFSHVVVIPNIIPSAAKPAPYSEAIPNTGLLMGRSRTQQKGFDIFLEALAITKMPGWHFSIIGPGCDSDPIILGLIKKYNLANHVSLLPATDDPYEYIRKTSCLIMPSRYEALPRVAMEALCIGRPVIASDADGLRDLVVNDINGLTFPCGDVSNLSACLRRIRDNAHILERLALASNAGLGKYEGGLVVKQWRAVATDLRCPHSRKDVCKGENA
jgi:glycosyltransferase involved in cell wall biosynthesis